MFLGLKKFVIKLKIKRIVNKKIELFHHYDTNYYDIDSITNGEMTSLSKKHDELFIELSKLNTQTKKRSKRNIP